MTAPRRRRNDLVSRWQWRIEGLKAEELERRKECTASQRARGSCCPCTVALEDVELWELARAGGGAGLGGTSRLAAAEALKVVQVALKALG